MTTISTPAPQAVIVSPYEAAVRLGWSDSVASLISHTRRHNPGALVTVSSRSMINLSALATDTASAEIVVARLLARDEI